LDNLSITQPVEEEIDTPEIDALGNACEGFVLNAIESVYDGYQWFIDGVAVLGETASSFLPEDNVASSIQVGVINEVNGQNSCAFSAPLNISPEPEIELNATFPEVLCVDEIGSIELSISPQGSYDILWNTGETDPTIDAEIGSYDVLVTNTSTSCSQSLAFEILPCESNPLQVNLSDLRICSGEEARFEANVTGGVPPYDFTWTPDLGAGPGPFNILVSESSSYSLSVVDAEGNSSSASISIEVEDCDCNIYVPNAFTPDADGLNEVFKVSIDCDIESYDLRIFNRWGIQVFSSNNPNEAWLGGFDDYYNGNTVYNYILKVQKANERLAAPIIRKGSITVVR
jgi:gliding motility-associated-like protein